MIRITVNEPGAATLNEARPMVVDGKGVYVSVVSGIATLWVCGEAVAQMDADDMTTRGAQSWAVEYLNQDIPTEPDMDAVNEALYGPAVEAVRATGATLARDAEAARQEAPTGGHRYRLATGRVTTVTPSDPRHPAQVAYAMKREADILTAWTSADESGYVRYVSNGLADVDGTFFPMGRASWKTSQS